MKIYVTKYLFTNGIQVMEAEPYDDEYPGMATVQPTSNGCFKQYFHGTDWHRTYEAARKQALKMCERKLVAIDKQRAKIETLSTSIPEAEP